MFYQEIVQPQDHLQEKEMIHLFVVVVVIFLVVMFLPVAVLVLVLHHGRHHDPLFVLQQEEGQGGHPHLQDLHLAVKIVDHILPVRHRHHHLLYHLQNRLVLLDVEVIVAHLYQGLLLIVAASALDQVHHPNLLLFLVEIVAVLHPLPLHAHPIPALPHHRQCLDLLLVKLIEKGDIQKGHRNEDDEVEVDQIYFFFPQQMLLYIFVLLSA